MSGAFGRTWIGDGELPELPDRPTLAHRAAALLAQQRAAWDLARQGYEALGRVQVREAPLGPFALRLQHNPGRRASSSARVDAGSIRQRPCFLCAANLPAGQRAVPCGAGYALLVNPFPIAAAHFTVPSLQHRPQRISAALPDLLALARDLGPQYVAFYNGPRCGASAPDHLHFQVIPAGFMPLDRDFEALRRAGGEVAGERSGVRVSLVDRIPCRCIALEAGDAAALGTVATALLAALDRGTDDDEPMVNLLAAHGGNGRTGGEDAPGGSTAGEGGWRLTVIPRARHRPSLYSADGSDGFLVSPASVDLGGVCIAPRQEDFQRLGAAHLRQMFDEVCLPATDLQRAAAALLAEGATTQAR